MAQMLLMMAMMMIFSIGSTKSMNPMKVSMMILAYSASMLFTMQISQSSAWFSSIFFLLFMGGILIMFMVLSSIMPNEPAKKSIPLKFKMLTLIVIMMFMGNLKLENMLENMSKMKWMMEASTSMWLMTLMILMYFLYFISILSKEKYSLRTNMCY